MIENDDDGWIELEMSPMMQSTRFMAFVGCQGRGWRLEEVGGGGCRS